MNNWINVDICSSAITEEHYTMVYKGCSVSKTIIKAPLLTPCFGVHELEFHLIKLKSLSSEGKSYKIKEEYLDDKYIIKDYEKECLSSKDADGMEFEIQNICSKLDKIKGNVYSYLYIKPYSEEGQELPLYLSSAISKGGLEFDNISEIVVPKLEFWLKTPVYNGFISNTCVEELYNFLCFMGSTINKFFDMPSNSVESLDLIKKVRNFLKHDLLENGVFSASSTSDSSIRVYSEICANDFLEYVKNKKIVKECSNCGELFLYREDKKYCSPECLKSSANKRNYQKRKQKLSKS